METIIKINKKQVIIDAAADLFKEKGYKATSIRDLASKVGLEPSSIYSHIRSKEDLLCEICMVCALKFSVGMTNVMESQISPRKKIKLLISLHLDIAYDNPASATVFNDEWKFLPELELKEFLELRKKYETNFKKILLRGKKKSKFEFINEDIVFNVIIKMLSWSYIGINKYNKAELRDELSCLIINAIDKHKSKS